MIPALEVKHENMEQAALRGYSTATDLADYLVKKGLPFRDAHEVVGKAVRFGLDNNKDLSEFTLEEISRFSPEHIDQDVFDILTLKGSVEARNHIGGTAPAMVKAAVSRGKKRIRDAK